MWRAGMLCLSLVAVGVVLSGCGSDEPSTEELVKERRDASFAAQQSFLAKSPKIECEMYTSSLVKEVFLTPVGCRSAARTSSLEPRRVDVIGPIKVDGSRANLEVALRGNHLSGTAGHMALRKQDGDWRVDQFGIDLLRSQLVTALQGPAFAAEKVYSTEGIANCAATMLDKASAARVRIVAYDFMRASTDSGAIFRDDVIRPCLVTTRPGRVLLRKEFEAGVADGGRQQGQSPKERRCVRGELRKTLSSQVIAEDVTSKADALSRPVSKAIAAATEKCT